MFARVFVACSLALTATAQMCSVDSECGSGYVCHKEPASATTGTCQPLPPLSEGDSCIGRVYDCPTGTVCYPGENNTMTCISASGTLCVLDIMCATGEVCYFVVQTDFLGVCVMPPAAPTPMPPTPAPSP